MDKRLFFDGLLYQKFSSLLESLDLQLFEKLTEWNPLILPTLFRPSESEKKDFCKREGRSYSSKKNWQKNYVRK